MRRLKFQLLLAVAALCSAPVRADVVRLAAAKDTTIQEQNPDNADGGGAGLFAGTNGNKFRHRALLAFDLSTIPSGSTIMDVQLTLTLGQVAGSGGGGGGMIATHATISLYPLARNWGQGTAGNNTQSPGFGTDGGGYPSSPGDATWNAAFEGQTLWTAAGGDYASTASTTLNLTTNTANMPFTWTSTAQLVADVQGWLNRPSTNFGWALVNADEVDARTFYAFYSSDWHTFTGGDASQEPVLQVTYNPPAQVPVPPMALWGTLAALTILCGRSLPRRG